MVGILYLYLVVCVVIFLETLTSWSAPVLPALPADLLTTGLALLWSVRRRLRRTVMLTSVWPQHWWMLVQPRTPPPTSTPQHE